MGYIHKILREKIISQKKVPTLPESTVPNRVNFFAPNGYPYFYGYSKKQDIDLSQNAPERSYLQKSALL